MNRGFFVFRDKGKTNIYIQLKASQGCNARFFFKEGVAVTTRATENSHVC